MHDSSPSAPAPEHEAPPPLGEVIVDPGRWALFLDFDGTLVELADTPESIEVPPALPALLGRLNDRLAGALALVTGRSLENLDRHLGIRFPAAGQHGAQWRVTPESAVETLADPALEGARRRVAELARAWPRLLVEDKGATLAVHYRSAPEAGPAIRDALDRLADASGATLEVLMGNNVCELRPAGVDKGLAVEKFLGSAAFAGRLPLMVGDDVTDEAGFRAALGAGGAAVKVGDGDSLAPWRLPTPAGVREWLAGLLEAGQ